MATAFACLLLAPLIVRVSAFGNSHQAAVRPQGGNEATGIFAIGSPFGDDFPILFNPLHQRRDPSRQHF